ncbi:MAG: hypothetical protein ABIT20_17085 [Gemmatimonadaceae bacterium]
MPNPATWRSQMSNDSSTAHSLYPMLCAVRHALHPALVSSCAFARVGSAMANLPDALTSLFYLETRLHDADAVDLVLRVGPESRETLWRCGTRDAAWDRVRALTHAWNDEHGELASALHHLWLEFDIDDASSAPRLVPGVFACFGELRDHSYTSQRWLARSRLALDTLLGDALPAAVSRAVDACFAALPDDAYAPYVGVMLGRPAESVRICLTQLGPLALSAYLERIGWPSPIGEVDALIAELASTQPDGPLRGAGMVHLDVSSDGIWRLGLEFACQRGPQLRGELRERALLERLVALGLAQPAKAEALTVWPGARAVRVPAASGDRVVMRRVNHVKVVLRPDGAPEAKAYLAARHVPRAQFSAVARAGSITNPTSERRICS